MLNKFLQSQIQKHLGETNNVPSNLATLFTTISASYDHYEKDRKLLERSVDISSTEMIALHQNLKEASRELNYLFNNIEEVMFSMDMVTYRIIQITPACEKLYGYTPQEFYADPEIWMKVMYPEDYCLVNKYSEIQPKDKNRVVVQCRIIRKDGSIRWIESSSTPSFDDNDKLLRIDGVVIDVTEKTLAEQKLKESHEEIKKILNSTNDAFFAMDMISYKYISISSACEKIYGYTAEDFLSNCMLWKEVIHPDDTHLANFQDERLNRNQCLDLQYRIIHKDSTTRWVEVKVIPTLDDTGTLTRVDAVINNITERKKAEQDILESSARLKKAQQIAHLGSWELNFATGLAHWSEEACRIYGLPPEDNAYTYDQWIGFIHPKDSEHVLTEIKKSQASLLPSSFDHRIIRDDGMIRYIHSECIFQFNHEGVPVGLSGIAHDITERKKAEQRLNLQFVTAKLLSQSTSIEGFTSAILKVVCENLNWDLATMWVVDETANVLRHTDSWHSPSAEVADFTLTSRESTFPEGLGLPGGVWENAEPTWIKDVTVDNSFMRAQSAAKSGLHGAVAFPIQNEGKVMGVLEVFSHKAEEVDEALIAVLSALGPQIAQFFMRKKAEELLHQSEANLRTIFENADVGFLLMDIDYNVVANNDMISQWSLDSFGFSLVKGMNLRAMLLPEKLPEFDDMMSMIVNGGQVNYETQYPNIDGTVKWLYINGKPVRDGNNRVIGLCLAITNVTLRKNNEEEIVRLNESLEEKVKLRTQELLLANKEMEAFSYSVSHDLRAPLRVINGYAKMMEKSQAGKLDKNGEADLKVIMDNAMRMGNLIDDLLDFSRLGRASISKNPVNMTDMVKVVIEEVKAASGATAEIQMQDFEPTDCDPALMKQVWTNLISNAFKYSRKKEKPVIEIGSTGLNGHRTYYVKDNGAGFDMKHSDKLFAVFQRLHKVTEYEGTGVGLALVQRIINKHGGNIWADGKVGEGATFYFTLA